MEEKKIKIGELYLNYKIFKKENNINNIIILHGWGGKSDSWIEVGKLLNEKGYNVIIPDLPGFGKTKIDKVFNLDDYAELIEKFIEKLSFKDFFLWGHSNGGAISIKIINRGILKPNLLILNNSAGIRNDKKRSLKRKILNNLVKPLKILKKIKGFKRIRELFYRIIGGQDYLKAEKNPFLKQTYLNMISSDLKEKIKKINVKTFLIWGEKDSYTPISDGIFMKENIINSEFVSLENQTHGIHLKNPELLVNTFLELIKK